MISTTHIFSKEQEEIGFLKIVQVTTHKMMDVIKEYNDTIFIRRVENGKKQINQQYTNALQTLKRYQEVWLLQKLGNRKQCIEEHFCLFKRSVVDYYRSTANRMENVLNSSTLTIIKFTGIDTVSHKLNDGRQLAPALVNLPSKEEVKYLTQRIEGLIQQLDSRLDRPGGE